MSLSLILAFRYTISHSFADPSTFVVRLLKHRYYQLKEMHLHNRRVCRNDPPRRQGRHIKDPAFELRSGYISSTCIKHHSIRRDISLRIRELKDRSANRREEWLLRRRRQRYQPQRLPPPSACNTAVAPKIMRAPPCLERTSAESGSGLYARVLRGASAAAIVDEHELQRSGPGQRRRRSVEQAPPKVHPHLAAAAGSTAPNSRRAACNASSASRISVPKHDWSLRDSAVPGVVRTGMGIVP
jgi:hypothetical protein